jgi:hypothetical protein
MVTGKPNGELEFLRLPVFFLGSNITLNLRTLGFN